jgi:hypothetical protein
LCNLSACKALSHRFFETVAIRPLLLRGASLSPGEGDGDKQTGGGDVLHPDVLHPLDHEAVAKGAPRRSRAQSRNLAAMASALAPGSCRSAGIKRGLRLRDYDTTTLSDAAALKCRKNDEPELQPDC